MTNESLKIIEGTRETNIKEVRNFLLETSDFGFDSVLIIGRKDGQIHINGSCISNSTEFVGLAFTALTKSVMTGWKE